MYNWFEKIKDRFSYRKYIKDYRKNIITSAVYHLNDDLDSGKIIETGITDRDKLYTDLLESYVELTKKRNKCKEIHKWIFFWIIIALGILVCVFLIYSINSYLPKNTTEQMDSNIVALITALLSLISTVIAIPLIVAMELSILLDTI